MRPDPELERLASLCPAYTTDSRLARPGDLFVALRGSARDGHDFVPALVAAGVGCVVETGAAGRLGLEEARAAGRVVEVEDAHAAHRDVAAIFRRRFAGKVLAVGGSSGKTTAKEFVAAILERSFRVAKTDRSQNGELGIPKTLEKLREGVEVAVVEIGIDAPGDMARHAAIVAPDLAILTSIGEEHLNLLGSVDAVFREETVLFRVTRERGGSCFAPEDDERLRTLAGTPGVRLVPSDPESLDPAFATPLRHPYARRNAALACAAASELGVPREEIAAALATLVPPDGRGGERRTAGGAVLVLDHYNANPSSMRAGLAAARARADEEGLPLRLVVGDMLDLGTESRRAHDGIVGPLREARPESLWLVGPEMGRIRTELADAAPEVRAFPDSAAAARCAAELRTPPSVVLFKGSRGMALERVIEAVETEG